MWLDRIELFHEMLDISRNIGHPKHWKTDLTKHDKNMIVDLNPGRYYWVVRECGTHILPRIEAEKILRQVCCRALFVIRISEIGEMHEISEVPVGSLYR